MKLLTRRTFVRLGAFGAFGLASPTIAKAAVSHHHVILGAGPKGMSQALAYQMAHPHHTISLIDKAPSGVERHHSPLAPRGVHKLDYEKFRSQGGRVLKLQARALDKERGRLYGNRGELVSFDTLECHLGLGFGKSNVPGMEAVLDGRILHGWQDHVQADLLWQRVQVMEKGGVYVLAAPNTPIRYDDGVAKRANLIASYMERHNPTAKVVVLDSHRDHSKQSFTSDLIEFEKADVLDILPHHSSLETTSGYIKASILNVIPPHEPVGLNG